jgi:hypothetical protein
VRLALALEHSFDTNGRETTLIAPFQRRVAAA